MTLTPADFTANARLVGIDWGTSNLRLWVMGESGDILAERRSDKGMSQLRQSDYPKVIEELLSGYDLPPAIPIVICGMAGARTAWQEAPYLPLPACFADLATHAVHLSQGRHQVSIIGGMAQMGAQKPDVMRGEETLLYGAYLLQSFTQDALICLPGTHSKWVHLAGDKVTSFTSFMTGELYQLISQKSLLAPLMADDEFDEAVFCEAVKTGRDAPQNLSAELFGLRAASLLSHIHAAAPASRLSGLLIGAETAGAWQSDDDKPLYLLASGRTQRLYQLAFAALSLQHQVIEADEMAQIALFNLGQTLAK